jgi:Putative zinc-finger
MSKHVTEWLSAYADGELHGSRLQHVKTHLAECEVCQMELESLDRLSGLLQEAPVPDFIAPERFAAQVNLRLPHPKQVPPSKKVLEIGWWMIPVGLLASWIFINVLFLASHIVSAANNFGLLTGVSNWMLFGTANTADWSATLGQFGVLSGGTLDLAASIESFARTSLPQITLQISIAFLYLSWIAIWWARHWRQEHGQLLEG